MDRFNHNDDSKRARRSANHSHYDNAASYQRVRGLSDLPSDGDREWWWEIVDGGYDGNVGDGRWVSYHVFFRGWFAFLCFLFLGWGLLWIFLLICVVQLATCPNVTTGIIIGSLHKS